MKEGQIETKRRTPWLWIPTLYFAEGIPYFVVNNISVLMLAKMGVPNGQMALFTSLLYLPWTIKPFWSPFVDIIRTKRWWTIGMQVMMSIAFILLTLTMPKPDASTIASGQTPISMFTIIICYRCYFQYFKYFSDGVVCQVVTVKVFLY